MSNIPPKPRPLNKAGVYLSQATIQGNTVLYPCIMNLVCEWGASFHSDNLFPFGADEGDLLLTGDDNASPARILSPMFPFYGTSYSALFVSWRI